MTNPTEIDPLETEAKAHEEALSMLAAYLGSQDAERGEAYSSKKVMTNAGMKTFSYRPRGYEMGQINNLFGRLIKNARSIQRFGRSKYPIMTVEGELKEDPVNVGSQKVYYTLSNSPALSKTHTNLFPVLKRIADVSTNNGAGGDSNCLSMSHGKADTIKKLDLYPVVTTASWSKVQHLDGAPAIGTILDHLYQSTKTLSTPYGRDLIHQCHDHFQDGHITCDAPRDEKGDSQCNDASHANPECRNCTVCSVHGQVLRDALSGTLDTTGGPRRADRLRVKKFKDVIDVCDSWANHLEDNGATRETYQDDTFLNCGENHARAASFLRECAQAYRSAAGTDQSNSGGRGGFIHRSVFKKFSRKIGNFISDNSATDRNTAEY